MLPRQRFGQIVFWLWVAVLLAVCVRVGINPHKQSSYAADYAPAGWHWLNGTDYYRRQHHFVYSPLAAAFFAPFSLLSDPLGGMVWRLFSAVLLLLAAAAWGRSRLASLGDLPAPRDVSPAFLLLLPLAVGNLNLGQMNVLVLVLTVTSVLAVERARWNLAAGCVAAAAFIKIYPLATGLLLALLYPGRFSWQLALALLGLFALSFGLQSPGYVWAEYHHWFRVLGGDDRLDVDLYATWRDFGYLLRAGGVPLSDFAYRVMEVASGGALALFLWYGQQRGRWSREQLLGGVLCLGCAWMMLFGPATEAATYVVLSLPACGLLVAAWTRPPESGRMAARLIFTTAYVLLLLADVTQSWFRGLTHHLFMRALQPVAALIFAGGVIWSLLRRRPADAMLSSADADEENGGGDWRVG